MLARLLSIKPMFAPCPVNRPKLTISFTAMINPFKKLMVFTLLCVALPVLAQEHKHKEHKEHKDEAKVEVKIPDTAQALWAAIDAGIKTLRDVIAAKQGETHEAAETVEALALAISAKYPDLGADQKKRADGQAKNIGRLLDQLHEEADDGHWEDASKKLQQVDGALKIIRTQVGG